MKNKEIKNIILHELEQFIKAENLRVLNKECNNMILTIILSDNKNYIYINYSIHPNDFPYELMICFGKIKVTNDRDLDLSDYKPKLPLWWINKNYNPSMNISENEKIDVIKAGCNYIIDCFQKIREMSIEDFTKHYDCFLDSLRESK